MFSADGKTLFCWFPKPHAAARFLMVTSKAPFVCADCGQVFALKHIKPQAFPDSGAH